MSSGNGFKDHVTDPFKQKVLKMPTISLHQVTVSFNDIKFCLLHKAALNKFHVFCQSARTFLGFSRKKNTKITSIYSKF